MPKRKFEKLDPQRRQEIIDIATAEFAQSEFCDVSMDSIARKLGLSARKFGSYFDSKLDLLQYLIDRITRIRFERLSQLAASGMDFFALIRQNFIDKLDFDAAHPNESMMAYRIFMARDEPELAEYYNHLKNIAIKWATEAIEPHVKSGTLRSDIPPALMAVTVVQTQYSLIDILKAHKPAEDQAGAGPVFNMPREEVLLHLDAVIELLKRGLNVPEAIEEAMKG